MPDQEPRPPSMRLFIAADPEPWVVAALRRWSEPLGHAEGVRSVRSDQLHFTLRFLGQVQSDRVDALAAIVAALPRSPIEVRFEPGPAQPIPRRRPRVVALGAESAGMAAVQARLVGDLIEAGLDRDDGRPFWPHLTVARIGRTGRLDQPLPELPDELTEPFGAVRIALYRSKQRSGGVEYESLASLDLPRPGAGGTAER